jgi:hypothetical protein
LSFCFCLAVQNQFGEIMKKQRIPLSSSTSSSSSKQQQQCRVVHSKLFFESGPLAVIRLILHCLDTQTQRRVIVLICKRLKKAQDELPTEVIDLHFVKTIAACQSIEKHIRAVERVRPSDQVYVPVSSDEKLLGAMQYLSKTFAKYQDWTNAASPIRRIHFAPGTNPLALPWNDAVFRGLQHIDFKNVCILPQPGGTSWDDNYSSCWYTGFQALKNFFELVQQMLRHPSLQFVNLRKAKWLVYWKAHDDERDNEFGRTTSFISYEPIFDRVTTFSSYKTIENIGDDYNLHEEFYNLDEFRKFVDIQNDCRVFCGDDAGLDISNFAKCPDCKSHFAVYYCHYCGERFFEVSETEDFYHKVTSKCTHPLFASRGVFDRQWTFCYARCGNVICSKCIKPLQSHVTRSTVRRLNSSSSSSSSKSLMNADRPICEWIKDPTILPRFVRMAKVPDYIQQGEFARCSHPPKARGCVCVNGSDEFAVHICHDCLEKGRIPQQKRAEAPQTCCMCVVPKATLCVICSIHCLHCKKTYCAHHANVNIWRLAFGDRKYFECLSCIAKVKEKKKSLL